MFGKFTLGAAAALLAVSLSSTSASAQTTLHIAHDQPETGTLHILFTEFQRLVAEKTGGAVTVRVTCCGTMGDNERTTESVRLGVLDGTAAAAGNLGGFLPKVALLSAPYLIESADHLAAVVDPESAAFAELMRITEASGELALGGVFITGVRSVYNSKGPIVTPADLAGMRMRVMSTEVQMTAWDTLGASPTNLAFSELYTGLMSGVVDAAENSPMFYYNMKHFEHAPYFSLTNHQYSSGLVLFNKASLDRLAPEVRQQVLDASFEATALARDYDTTANEEFMKKLVEAGVKVNEANVPEFVALSRPLHDQIAAQIGAQDLLAAIRAAAQ
jgi:tripartite ATP-independent transporter DctP family solute receptor